MKKISKILLALAGTALLALAGSMAAMAAEVGSSVLSTTPITKETFWGTRVMAVAVEYDKEFDAQEFALDTFIAEDLKDSENADIGYIMTAYNNTRIYTNDEAGFLDDEPKAGNFIIIEFEDDWKTCGEKGLGVLVVNYFYKDAEGNNKNQNRWVKPNEGTVLQTADITAADGTVIPAWKEAMPMTNDYLHTGNSTRFELVQIPREDLPDRPYNALVALPEDYDPSKKYPVIFQVTGISLQEWKIGDVMNTDDVLYFDRHLTAWTEKERFGIEDVIVVSLRIMSPYGPYAGTPENYDNDMRHEDTAKAAYWFLDNYPIDRERVYWTGQSYGSFATWHILHYHPDLATGFVALNGGIQFQNVYDDPETSEQMKAELKEFLKPILDNKVKLYINFGEQDYNGCNAAALFAYEEVIIDYYMNEMGLTKNEVSELLKTKLWTHSRFMYADGMTDHAVVRLIHWFDTDCKEMMDIVLNW